MEYREIEQENYGEIISLWNKNIGVAYPMDHRLFEENLEADHNFKKIVAAYCGGSLIGFVIMKQWTEKSGNILPNNGVGHINSIIVDANYRNQGIGSELLNKAEDELKAKGVKKLTIGGDHFHFFPGVPMEFRIFEKILLKRAYEASNIYNDMICDISKVDLEKLQGIKLNNKASYIIETLNDSCKDELLSFLERCFSGRWYGDINSFFDMGMDNSDIVVIKDGNKIIGFCHIYDSNSITIGPPIYWRELLGENYGGLGPIGIDASYRGGGLGQTILYKSLELLKARGVKNMVIDWTDLVEFYGKFSFIPWKKYKKFTKEL